MHTIGILDFCLVYLSLHTRISKHMHVVLHCQPRHSSFQSLILPDFPCPSRSPYGPAVQASNSDHHSECSHRRHCHHHRPQRHVVPATTFSPPRPLISRLRSLATIVAAAGRMQTQYYAQMRFCGSSPPPPPPPPSSRKQCACSPASLPGAW
jgi:hypothetical protein